MHEWKQKGWVKTNKRPVMNQELWMRLDRLLGEGEVILEHCPGHSGRKDGNYWADRLARGLV